MYPYYDVYNLRCYRCSSHRSQEEKMQIDEEIITLEEAISLIEQSVGDEKEDEMFYSELLATAPNQKEKDIIASIRDDEKKHNSILRELYYKLTGNMLPHDMPMPEAMPNMSYSEQLEKALFGELEAVKKYRKIMAAMPDSEGYTLLMSIMTDEMRHANKYNFLIASQKS